MTAKVETCKTVQTRIKYAEVVYLVVGTTEWTDFDHHTDHWVVCAYRREGLAWDHARLAGQQARRLWRKAGGDKHYCGPTEPVGDNCLDPNMQVRETCPSYEVQMVPFVPGQYDDGD